MPKFFFFILYFIYIITDDFDIFFFVKIEKLKNFADSIDYQFELDPLYLKDILAQGQKGLDDNGNEYLKIRPIKINEDPKYSSLSPYHHSKFYK